VTRRTEPREPAPTTLATASQTAEVNLGRFLIGLTYVAVLLLVLGVAILLASGLSPLSGGPDLELTRFIDDLRAVDAAGLLWLGLLAVIATPLGRVLLAGIVFARQRDWHMVGVAVAILVIVSAGVVIARAGTV
jgi:uncharacterized membrane protein